MPDSLAADDAAPRAVLPDALRLGPVRLAVAVLDRSVDFYTRVVGIEVVGRECEDEHVVARLGAGGEELVVLQQEPGGRPAGRHAGLYHVALNYPSRAELARAVRRIVETGTPIQGASDHRTHEAIYLPDPDGNGLELAWDLPREQWPPTPEQYAGGPQPLDLRGLLDLTDGEPLVPQAALGLRVGHLHLHVGDLGEALGFYAALLGFELQVNLGTAAFLSAGGYHHHLAVNTWRGEGAPPAPAGSVGLREWTIYLPDAAAVDAVRRRLAAGGVPVSPVGDAAFTASDPWAIPLQVSVDPDRG